MKEQVSRLIKNLTSDKTGDLIRKADEFRDRREWREASESYRLALELDEGLPHIWVQYGHALKESGQHRNAEGAYLRALSLQADADVHLQLGHLHKIMGRIRESERDYLRVLDLEPDNSDAKSELAGMGWNSKKIRAGVSMLGRDDSPEQSPIPGTAFVAFEISDLIDHLQRNPHPTGIQRVQLELGAAITNSVDASRIQFVYYDHVLSNFYEVEFRQILDIIYLVDAVEPGEMMLRSCIDRIKADISKARPFEFPEGAYLVNVGTSWGFLNYFLTVREIKRRSNVRFVPLVHDCIPLIYPEFCNPNLVCDFINWITLMIGHADLILTNSENTKKDLRKVSEELGENLPPTMTIHLNGEYGDRNFDSELDRAALDTLQSRNLDVEDFVLFVSTIEPRKNHMLVLNAWSKMLKTRASAKVPRLVCVGNSGWMNDAFTQRLEADQMLRERVVVMRNVSDQVLQLLYRKCTFTLFPSIYEGWGLPISEALSYGKVPLVSNVSSHPEAGGALAVYFELGSESDFQIKLESLIDDVDMRKAREAEIVSAKPLRPWAEIARQIFDCIEKRDADFPKHAHEAGDLKSPPMLVSGRYYDMARNKASAIKRIGYSGDIYRAGTNWHGPEPFGCWVRGTTADIAFSLADEPGDEFLLYLRWTGCSNIENVATLSLPPSSWSKRIPISRGEERWDVIQLKFKPESKRDVRLRITADATDDFSLVSEGRDRRLASVGVKGLYVCRVSDGLQRAAISEAIVLGELDHLARRFPVVATL